MRAALIIGGLVLAGCLAVFGVVQAQKYAIGEMIWQAGTSRPATTAAAPTDAAQPKPGPRTVVTEIPNQATNSRAAAPAAAAPTVVAQGTAQAPAPAAAPGPAPATMPKPAPIACSNPNALGIARVVEIDTTGGPGFGFEHFKVHDFLRDHEVVLTFDDGPWLNNTPMVLKALADQCVRATFFPIGKHATYYPDILKQVAAAGHTIGNHTWSHQDLSKKSFEEAKEEIEKGMSAVRWAVGGPTAPFFRFPALRHPPELITYLGSRNVGIFSTDMDSFDFKMRKPEQVIKSVMDKLAKHGKGIILMHDFQQATAHALPQLLGQLKANGYKVVHLVPRNSLQTIAQYDEMLLKDQKLPTVDQRPTSSVVRTISE